MNGYWTQSFKLDTVTFLNRSSKSYFDSLVFTIEASIQSKIKNINSTTMLKNISKILYANSYSSNLFDEYLLFIFSMILLSSLIWEL